MNEEIAGNWQELKLTQRYGFWKSDHDFLIAFHNNFFLWCMVCEITRFYCMPDMTSSWFLRQGSLHAILHHGFWKGYPDFIFMFKWHFLSILNGLGVIRFFVFDWDFPTGAKCFGVWSKMTPKNVNWEKNTCWEGTSLRQTASFEPLYVKLFLSVWPVQVRKETKGRMAGRQEGRKESNSYTAPVTTSHSCYTCCLGILSSRLITHSSSTLSDLVDSYKSTLFQLLNKHASLKSKIIRTKPRNPGYTERH